MISLFKVRMPASIDAPLLETLKSGFIGQGPKVEEFERLLETYIGNPNVLTTNSGTMALMIALRLAGVKPGDDVVSSAMTCSATSMSIKAVGANIVWADILLDGNLNPDSVRRNITPKTTAVMAVHWAGYPCDLDALLNICDERGIQLVEDAAHALGAEYHDFKIGNYGHLAAFSLQAIKHINTIEGGFVCCDRRDSYNKGKLLRWFGIDREGPKTDLRCEQDITDAGYKGNLVDPLAVIGIEQMKGLPAIIEKHRENAEYYRNELHGLTRVRPLPYADDRASAYWLFSVLVDDKNSFMGHMLQKGIQVSAVHSRNDVFLCFADAKRGAMPGLDYFADHQMAIPVHWALTDDERAHIVNAVREYERGN
ncbi:MAG: DegT/DnrJ/EryC1/StrS family aminotransferase [Chloroflexi bacterium]|nr:DegT/DnrJ/EryC1/StrS family aminotransferase [Chloroflexota bacterium]